MGLTGHQQTANTDLSWNRRGTRTESGLGDSKLDWFSGELESWKPQLVLSRKGLLQPVGRERQLRWDGKIGGTAPARQEAVGMERGGSWGTSGGETHSWGLAIAAKGGRGSHVTSKSSPWLNGRDRGCRRKGALQSWGASVGAGGLEAVGCRGLEHPWGAAGKRGTGIDEAPSQ